MIKLNYTKAEAQETSSFCNLGLLNKKQLADDWLTLHARVEEQDKLISHFQSEHERQEMVLGDARNRIAHLHRWLERILDACQGKARQMAIEGLALPSVPEVKPGPCKHGVWIGDGVWCKDCRQNLASEVRI